MSNYVEARRRAFGGEARDERAGLTAVGNAGLERAAYYALLAFVALIPGPLTQMPAPAVFALVLPNEMLPLRP